jgi:hypothetical protein
MKNKHKVKAKTKVKATPVAPAPAPTPVKTPTVALAAPTATESAAAPAPAPRGPVPGSKFSSRDVIPALGRRMRVAEYQDYTFSINGRDDRRLTDEELCADWHAQFPQAVSFTTHHVRGARRDYNAGVHSKFRTQPVTNEERSVPYMKNEKGDRIPVSEVPRTQRPRATKDAPASAATETPAPKAEAPAPQTAVTAPTTKVRVARRTAA